MRLEGDLVKEGGTAGRMGRGGEREV